ncbi:hypothetical protein TNCV_480251 [Trichonephila clavipes]|nr:hypothetical protein TNCV_480251 [Trichonephila clavipes]
MLPSHWPGFTERADRCINQTNHKQMGLQDLGCSVAGLLVGAPWQTPEKCDDTNRKEEQLDERKKAKLRECYRLTKLEEVNENRTECQEVSGQLQAFTARRKNDSPIVTYISLCVLINNLTCNRYDSGHHTLG